MTRHIQDPRETFYAEATPQEPWEGYSAPLNRDDWEDGRLAEHGRRLASEREDLIAAGVNPRDLMVPLHPESQVVEPVDGEL